MSKEERDGKIELTIEERVEQLEKDVVGITLSLQKLLTWKRNQIARRLPDTQHEVET